MRVFSLLGLLVSVLIVGWMAALFLGSMGGGAVGPVQLQAAPQADAAAPASEGRQIRNAPIEMARDLVKQDKERQKKMQEAMNQP